MDKVKAALTDFTARSGHHDTTVHEAVAPAVTHEVIKPHQHEEVHTAVDKEVHEDHYHRTVQPVQDREVLPESHQAKIGAVQHREFDHRNEEEIKRKLAQEQAQFRDERRVEGTTQSQSVAPTIGGEHVHHHIHETIQPVIQKEVIQPTVVHTTVPIHEVHHNAATVHDTTALPTMTMSDFQKKGGVLSGREERYDEFEGVPKNIGGAGGFGHVRDSTHGSHTGSSGLTGHHSDSHGAGLGHSTHSSRDPSGNTARESTLSNTASGNTGRHVGTDGPIGGSNTSREGHHDSQKSSGGLMAKLNPKVDSDGDGKAGFMK